MMQNTKSNLWLLCYWSWTKYVW